MVTLISSGNIHVTASDGLRRRFTTQGPSWGYFKVKFYQVCQLLSTIRNKMAPRAGTRLQDRGRDTPTNGLLGLQVEGSVPNMSEDGTHKIPFRHFCSVETYTTPKTRNAGCTWAISWLSILGIAIWWRFQKVLTQTHNSIGMLIFSGYIYEYTYVYSYMYVYTYMFINVYKT